MDKTPKEERLKNIVCKGLEHLFHHLDYGQNNVLNKFRMLNHVVSAASLSNIKNGKPVGLPTLSLAAKGMQALLQQEMDMVFDTKVQDFRPQHTPGWSASVVPEKPLQSDPDFIMHADGRVSVQQKADFIADAKKEVIEVGVRLNSFSTYFTSHNEGAYKMHILALLRKGVDIKAYLLDPDCAEARIYFDDRARVQSFEKDSIEEIKKVIERLKSLCSEFEAMNLAGKFEVYLYRHIPYSLFYVVDGATEAGKMMISPYLYGIRRANSPVLEITRKDQPPLYRKYWESLQLYVDGAQKLTW